MSDLVQTLELQERHARPLVAQVARPSALVFAAALIASLLLMALAVGALWAYGALRLMVGGIREEMAARATAAVPPRPPPAELVDDAAFARLIASRSAETVTLTRARAVALAAAGRPEAARAAWIAARREGGADVAARLAEAGFLLNHGDPAAALAVLAEARPEQPAAAQAVAALVERGHLDAQVHARRAAAAGR